ncbi:plant UBX domain-containing protein 11 isoform X2 [Sorghum bicolor]|nr:plant UBX domain-containing protein 11 isoform X2 [Sorghum bicolor]|eukprot:XP_002489321.2 plant UBX domain-containing protein 11 isoform X2 [Sorghum bicolor]
MERTINSLMYKGSIPDAINQSRREKKLFVVYISGEDEASGSLEQSTLIDENVVEVIGRCCILLHLKQGNVDASQFSAIYPQKSVPSISVIGLNGVLLWNHEGYINSENLKESIEKAWAALHLQETAATLLTASLASRNVESVNTATTVLLAQGSSSTLENPSDLSSQSPDVFGASGVAHSTDLVSQVPSSTTLYEPLEINEREGSKSDSGDRTVEELGSTSTEFSCDLVDSSRKSNMVSSADPKGEYITASVKRKNKNDGSHTSVSLEDTPSTLTNRGVSSQSLVEQDKATTSAPPLIFVKSDDIQLSIRMPSGNRLEIKVTKQDVLRKVKNFVDENKGNELSSYDLSLVYPKRVFSEQDMEATLSDLGIQNRHAMIVVPHRQFGQVSRPQSSASYDVGGNSGVGVYFGYLRTVLSYANPLSYLRGNTNSSNPELQSNEGHGSGPWSEPRPLVGNRGHEVTDADSANMLRRRSRPFGANIHTLGNEDHGPSDERNVFWNGNSTEFGGDDRK